jgi:hypothetical protein
LELSTLNQLLLQAANDDIFARKYYHKDFMKACNMAVSNILYLIIYGVSVKVSVDYFNEVLQSGSYLGSKKYNCPCNRLWRPIGF